MKKIFVLSLVAAMALGLVSCTGGNQTTQTVVSQEKSYRDGTYRGALYDGTVVVEFSLKDNIVESAKFRTMKHKDTDYLKAEGEVEVALRGQYEEVLNHIVGKDIRTAVEDLYAPGEIAQDTDAFTAATVRSGKIVSAINDALNRDAYSLPKAE